MVPSVTQITLNWVIIIIDFEFADSARVFSVIEGRQVEIKGKEIKDKERKRKETNSAQHKAKYLSLFKLGHEKSPSSAYLVYLLMYVFSVFVLSICC